jgi:hypothetical protein
VHVSVHLAILESIRDVCKRVVKELTSWVIYSDDERKFNREITVGLIRSELIILTDYNLHLAKLIDGGRNSKDLTCLHCLLALCYAAMFWKVILSYTVPANNAIACGLKMVLLLKGNVDETY